MCLYIDQKPVTILAHCMYLFMTIYANSFFTSQYIKAMTRPTSIQAYYTRTVIKSLDILGETQSNRRFSL